MGSSSSSSSSSSSKPPAASDIDDDDYLTPSDSSSGGVCDVHELNTAFVRFNGLYSVLFSTDLHLLHALFRAMVAYPNRHSVTLSLVRVIEHAGQMDAVVRAAAASEVQSCSDAALLFRRRSLAFNLMKTLLQLLSQRVMSAVLSSVLPALNQLVSTLPTPPPASVLTNKTRRSSTKIIIQQQQQQQQQQSTS